MGVEREITDVDDSFKRPGSIPFKWEIQPGVPRHTEATTASPPVLPQKLSLPPAMHTTLSPSQSPTLLSPSPSTSTSNNSQLFSSLGCFPSPSIKYRNDKKAAKIFSLLRRRSMSDHYMPSFASPPLSQSMREDVDAFEVSSSSLALSDVGSV